MAVNIHPGSAPTAKVTSTPANTPRVQPAPPAPAGEVEVFPKYTASEAPVRRLDRIAFQVWVICALLSVAVTLVFYLIDKLYMYR